jgi:hypothetical protein
MIPSNNDTGVMPEFTRNKNGVRIKKCCASCRFKDYKGFSDRKRLCKREDEVKVVDKSDCCQNWAISDEINVIKVGT